MTKTVTGIAVNLTEEEIKALKMTANILAEIVDAQDANPEASIVLSEETKDVIEAIKSNLSLVK